VGRLLVFHRGTPGARGVANLSARFRSGGREIVRSGRCDTKNLGYLKCYYGTTFKILSGKKIETKLWVFTKICLYNSYNYYNQIRK
jgi:hypothetical protein